VTGPATTHEPYQYVVLRCVPRVDREEFVNVAVALYCQASAYLRLAYCVNAERLRALDPSVEPGEVTNALDGLDDICCGSGQASGTTLGDRFGLVAAPRSTVIQPGPIHSGVTADPAGTLEELLERLVTC